MSKKKTLTAIAVAAIGAVGGVALKSRPPPCAWKPVAKSMCAEVLPDGGIVLELGGRTLAPGTFAGPDCVRKECDP